MSVKQQRRNRTAYARAKAWYRLPMRDIVNTAMYTFLALIVVDLGFYLVDAIRCSCPRPFLDALSFGFATAAAIFAGGTFYLKLYVPPSKAKLSAKRARPPSRIEILFYLLAAGALLVSHFCYLAAHDDALPVVVFSCLYVVIAAAYFSYRFFQEHRVPAGVRNPRSFWAFIIIALAGSAYVSEQLLMKPPLWAVSKTACSSCEDHGGQKH